MPAGGAHLRVWAPERSRVRLISRSPRLDLDLTPEKDGYFSGTWADARPGSAYGFQLDDDSKAYADPASRFQPRGPHAWSQIVDPRAFPWTDSEWPGLEARKQILYEIHLGTFTPEGTWNAARNELRELAAIGITAIEIMPIAEFAGERGWGYDGVNLFAPAHVYGSPEDAKRFINEAHSVGIGVILDVVYNHLGPEGNYLGQFSRDYFTSLFHTDWGEAINFGAAPVREFYSANATYWIEEYHFDGLRFDATQNVYDLTGEHILAEITAKARQAAVNRKLYFVAENEPQHTRLVRPQHDGGYGIDALWNDDFHHSAMVALTGRNEGYYSGYQGAAQELLSAVKYGYLFQGQYFQWQDQRRGTPAFDLEPWRFVNFIQNHDQVANTARGERPNMFVDKALYRAMSALLLLAPGTPMLFQGQEFGATTPFLYFCDYENQLCDNVHKGRREFLAQFHSLATPEMQALIANPAEPAVFESSKLNFGERVTNRPIYSLYKDLIRLRKIDPVFAGVQRRPVDGAVLRTQTLAIRYFGEAEDRLMIVNLGNDLCFAPAPEPLLAPPENSQWKVLWSSEDPRYGGLGTADPETREGWRIPGRSAIVMCPASREDAP